MADYCCNNLDVGGSHERLKEFDKQFRKIHNEYEQFTLTRPLEKQKFDSLDKDKLVIYEDKENQLAYVEKRKRSYSFENFVPKKSSDDIINWYNFNIKNWGTRIDLLHMELINNKSYIEEGRLYYSFVTLWGNCIEIIQSIAKQYPDLEFSYVFAADESESAGVYRYKNGEVILSYDYENFQDYGYRQFKHDYLEAEFLKCEDCGYLIEDGETDGECPECESKNITKEFLN